MTLSFEASRKRKPKRKEKAAKSAGSISVNRTLIPRNENDCMENIFDNGQCFNPRANGAERRSCRKPRARVLIPTGYLHLGKGKH
jgi:hypothetical protein